MASSSREPRVRVICLGETMLMFAPPQNERIEYSLQFNCLHGGAESNVAIGLERLGMHAAWIGKLPYNALGRKIVNELRSFGVDTRGVVWTETGRVGTFFFEWAQDPRPLKTIYDRANSAATTMVADDLDWDYIGAADWLQLTGITPALSPTTRVRTIEIARRARALGLKVLFDVNYRSLLWSREEACGVCAEILQHTHIVVGSEPDLAMVLGETLDRREALRRVVGEHGCDTAVMTLGAEGCLGFDGTSYYEVPAHHVDIYNRLGRGDAFDAGLLYGSIMRDLETGLAYGCAMAALKMTVPQNIPLVDKEDVERLVAGRYIDMVR